jgi:hypothetical protein
VLLLTMALRMVRSLCIHAVSASFLGSWVSPFLHHPWRSAAPRTGEALSLERGGCLTPRQLRISSPTTVRRVQAEHVRGVECPLQLNEPPVALVAVSGLTISRAL